MNIVDKYRLISQIGYICAVVFLVIAVILFFTLKINRVFGYITGISRKKAIKEINEHNSYTSDVSSGIITQDTGRKLGRTSKIGGVPITSKIPTSKITQNNIEETTVLSNDETTLLYTEETTLLNSNNNVRPIYNVVSGSIVNSYQKTDIMPNEFIIIRDIVYINTDIVI